MRFKIITPNYFKSAMTIQEMELLTEYLKGTFWTKEEGRVLELKMESMLNKIQTSLDRFAIQSENNRQEITVLNNRMKTTEEWIDQASPKLGLEFKH
jgi:hypothetical protein